MLVRILQNGFCRVILRNPIQIFHGLLDAGEEMLRAHGERFLPRRELVFLWIVVNNLDGLPHNLCGNLRNTIKRNGLRILHVVALSIGSIMAVNDVGHRLR